MTHTPSTDSRTATSGTSKPETTKTQGTAPPRLSLKTKPTTPETAENATQTRTRSRKRIIRRDELPANWTPLKHHPRHFLQKSGILI